MYYRSKAYQTKIKIRKQKQTVYLSTNDTIVRHASYEINYILQS